MSSTVIARVLSDDEKHIEVYTWDKKALNVELSSVVFDKTEVQTMKALIEQRKKGGSASGYIQ